MAPLPSGHSDVAIGTRRHPSAQVVRAPRRELVSRCYNLLLHAALGVGFSDAQCGFKAIRRDVAAERVNEVAERIGRRPARSPRTMRAEIVFFAVIGALSTVLHLGGFGLLREVVASAPAANAVALLVAAVANTWANRRWTFAVRGRSGAARHQVQGLVVFATTLGMTTAGLTLLQTAMPEAPTSVESLVVAVTTAAATAMKFLAMKLWVFAPESLRPAPPRPCAAESVGPTGRRAIR